MEEGSPSVFPKYSRVTKRVRAAADCDFECAVESDSNPNSMQGLKQAPTMNLMPKSECTPTPMVDLL